MSKKNALFSNDLTTKTCSFPFLNLPRELRDEIYPYCFEPEFRQSTFANLHSSYRIPLLEAVHVDLPYHHPDLLGTICCNSTLHLEDNYEGHSIFDQKPQFVESAASILTYRLGDALSLLLVSKQINHEITPLLKEIYETFDAAIETHHIKSPSPTFLELFVHGRFIFDAGPTRALNFLIVLPEYLKPLVLDVAFISTCAYWDTAHGSNTEWYSLNIPWEDRWFTEKFLDAFPNLGSIALEVPAHISECKRFHAGAALKVLSNLLLAGIIDVVRLLYRKRCLDKRHSTDHMFIYDNFDRFNDTDPPQSQQPHSPTSIAARFPRRFNVIEIPPWTIGEKGIWFSESGKMERLVEITRCKGTEAVAMPVRPYVPPPCYCQVCTEFLEQELAHSDL